MHKRTKALGISPAVKKAVYVRDGGCCVWCGSAAGQIAQRHRRRNFQHDAAGQPNAHFIPRSSGGLGVEENILTLCWDCHMKFDQTAARAKMREYFRGYLESKYPDWDENALTYKKYTED